MYLQRSPYAPVVTHELDTQNFEHFDEDARGMSGAGAKRWARADPNFIGYTYKSYEAVQPSDGMPVPAWAHACCLAWRHVKS